MKNYLLTIDNGNTRYKSKFFQLPNQEMVFETTLDYDIILSDVAQVDLKKINSEHANRKVFHITDYIQNGYFLDMPVNYASSIGADRIAQAYYCFHHYQKNITLIDIGTFITVDFISRQGFEGGFIYPGAEVLTQSYRRGKNLPDLTTQDLENYFSQSEELPHATKDAMLGAMKLTYQAFLNYQFLPSSQVILTGGQASLFSALLKNSILLDDLNFKSLVFIYQKIQEQTK